MTGPLLSQNDSAGQKNKNGLSKPRQSSIYVFLSKIIAILLNSKDRVTKHGQFSPMPGAAGSCH